ncbi:3D domain-containing protein [Neobacillus sedimentimangrovi]|jgi:3D (Asp-Asp-Asp) domain-containing protein|uniref:3D domain-containing protein n=1 Tax=Neobacillus sedimentimangrovi TaxID=2699460 RepID=UPI0013D15399|nr:3D domain-containing protein [Neobacillus sedimentimangrovi]
MQKLLKRITLAVLLLIMCVSGSIVTYAETDDLQSQLQEKENLLEQQMKEKQSVQQEIQQIKQELDSIYNEIEQNKKEMAVTQAKIDEVNKLIQQKREEIVILEDKILGRKEVMKKRAVALQHNSNVGLIINIFFESDSISEFIQRASAASTLMDADKEILIAQKEDLQQIEEDKKEIDRQEQLLKEQQATLANQQAKLDQNLQKRQETLTAMQTKYDQIVQQMAIAEQEKKEITAKMEAIKAEAMKAKVAQSAAPAPATASKSAPAPTKESSSAPKGRELYVSATAYSHEDSGSITALGYNIKANPNMKLIAVDPRVIPLGSKVWVEGYGTAIAGDTGGAIKGHKIDVLMPNKASALAWGRRTVKVIILN